MTNLEIVKDLYASAEAAQLDAERFAAFFGEDGYLLDVASGERFTGGETQKLVVALAKSFPDYHRELLRTYAAGDVVVVELKLQGTHTGAAFKVGEGTLPAAGARFDVPCCDVFHLREGKVVSFHCYNEQLIWLRQLGALDLVK